MSHQQLLLETTERFKTLIALTVEQCNAILDTYLQQVQAIQVGVAVAAPAKQEQQEQQKIIKPKIVVAVAAAAQESRANSPFSEHWPSNDGGFGVAAAVVDLNEEDENGQVDDSFIDDDQEDMIVDDDDDDDEEVGSIVEDDEDEDENDSSLSIQVSKASKKRAVPSPPPPSAGGARAARPQRNRKRTRLFSFEDYPNQDKEEVANDIDLFNKESDDDSSSPSAPGKAGGDDILLDDFRYFLRRIAAKGPRTSLISIMDATPFSRNRFVAPLNQIRQGLGHDGPRSRNARRLFDSILNNASVLQTGYKGGEKQTCALCCTKRNCTAELHVDGDTHYVANKCIRIAEALIPFSKMVIQLSKKDAETVNKKDLFELDKLFSRIMMAHANKTEEF